MENKINFEYGISHVIQRSRERIRNYSGSSKSVPVFARFKLQICFIDGNKRSFYSYDSHRHNGKIVIDESEGLMKLLRLVQNYGKRIRYFNIYINVEDHPATDSGDYNILVWSQGKWKNFIHDKIKFCSFGKNVKIDTTRITDNS